MRAIARAHASTRTTGLMRVKNSTHHFQLWHSFFKDENVLALDEIPSFSSDLYLFQSSNYTPDVNYVCDKLFILKANIFLYD